MPQRSYVLPPHQSGRLVITWQRGWYRCIIRWNGRRVGIIPHLSELAEKGKTFLLPNGATLTIEVWYAGAVLSDFYVRLNGQLLTWKERIERSLMLSYCTVFFIAGVNLLAGLLYLSNSLNEPSAALLFLGAGLSPLAFGRTAVSFAASALYLFLGLQIRQRSWQALSIALGAIFLDSAYLTFMFLWGSGETAVFLFPLLMARFILLISMAVGLEELTAVASSQAALNKPLAKIKQGTVNLLGLLVDPISWVFDKLNSPRR